MADNDNTIIEDSPANPGADVEMSESAGAGAGADAGEDEATAAAGRSEMPFAEEETINEPEPVPERTSFISYLTSPIVTLIVGSDETETILTAHQALLTLSPFFKDACAQFSDDGSVSTTDHPGSFFGSVAGVPPIDGSWRSMHNALA